MKTKLLLLNIVFLFVFLACNNKNYENNNYNSYLAGTSFGNESKAYVFFEKTNIYINNDLSYTLSNHRLLKLLDTSFIEYLASVVIEYSKSDEKVEIIRARTIKTDGRIVDVSKDLIQESKKYYDYPAYDSQIELKFTYPNVEKNDLLELKYRVISKNKFMEGHFDYAKVLASYYSKKSTEFTVNYPKKINLKYRILEREIPIIYKKVENKDRIEESFITENTAGYQIEPFMPKFEDIAPVVILSNYESWNQISDWYRNLAKNVYDSNEAMKKLVDAVSNDSNGDKIKIAQKLYTFVSRSVRYVGIWLGDGAYKPRKASEVFENLYGDCKDKTTLLISLLGLAGIKGEPILVSTRNVPTYFEDFPAMIFDHAITKITLGKNQIFVDPTSYTSIFGFVPDNSQGRFALDINNNKFFKLPIEKPEKNGSEYYVDLEIDDSGETTGKIIIKFRGEPSESFRGTVYAIKEKELKNKIKYALNDLIPGVDLKSAELRNFDTAVDPAELEVSFSSNKYFDKVDDLLIVPARLVPFKRSDFVVSQTRAFPIDFWTKGRHTTNYNYKYPFNYKIRNAPKNLKIDSRFFIYTLKVINSEKNNTLNISEEYLIDKTFIDATDYLGFKNDYEKLLGLSKKYIVFEKK